MVRLHFTPTYSSWLNQVELWFSQIERDLLARGIFTSVADVARHNSHVHSAVQQTGEADPMELSQSRPSD